MSIAEDNGVFMTWTNEPPSEHGWYWWRRASEDSPRCASILCVFAYNDILTVECGPIYRTVLEMGGQWAGPIPFPVAAGKTVGE
jgi:hypothetical protein